MRARLFVSVLFLIVSPSLCQDFTPHLTGIVTRCATPSEFSLSGKRILVNDSTNVFIEQPDTSRSVEFTQLPSQNLKLYLGEPVEVYGNIDAKTKTVTADRLLLYIPLPHAVAGSALIDAILPLPAGAAPTDRLVRADGYDVLEIPFPESLALRYGWAANGQILGYTYNLDPPVPAKTISTVSVNTHLVAHAGTDPAAISKLLEVVYSPAVAAKLRLPFDEKSISIPSGYPLSPGTGVYLARNDSILTLETWNKLTSSFGLLMGFGGMFIVVLKWFRGAEPTPVYDDKEFHGYMAEVVSIESMVAAMETARSINVREVRSMRARLNHLRAEVLDRYPRMRLKDANLFDHCIASVRAAHEHLGAVLAKERGRGIHSTAPPPAPEGSS